VEISRLQNRVFFDVYVGSSMRLKPGWLERLTCSEDLCKVAKGFWKWVKVTGMW